MGIIGAGAMGGAIANTLARELVDVQVFDVDPAKVDAAVAAAAG